MVRIKVEGPTEATDIIGSIVIKALRDAGLKAEGWVDVTPNEVGPRVALARKNGDQVAVLEMRP